MRSSLFFFIFLSFVLPTIVAQRTSPPRPRPVIRDINERRTAAEERKLRELREMELQRRTPPNDKTNSGIPLIYRKPAKEETAALDPPKEVVDRYSQFLKKSRTGIVTLTPREGCGTDGETVSAEESCLGFQFPGGGTAYSFRIGSYRTPRLADIRLKKNVLITDSIGQQGILVDLGERSIEDLDLKSAGFQFLVAFEPSSSTEEFQKASRDFEEGVNRDGFLYRLALFAKANHAFGLRSVAYSGQSTRSMNGVVYDEYAFDKRDDVLVVFTIADIAQNGNVTLVWRELRREDSPELKSPSAK
jgi:hypothetical protein